MHGMTLVGALNWVGHWYTGRKALAKGVVAVFAVALGVVVLATA